jgi:sulfatase modifying factor 1
VRDTALAVWALACAFLSCPAKLSALDIAGSAASRPADSPRTDGTGTVHVLRSPGPAMILVRASTFRMGSTPEEVLAAYEACVKEPFGHRCHPDMFSDELPARTVQLSAFWLDRTEVTVAEYAHCVRLGRCREVPFNLGARRFEHADFPRSRVTWEDAVAYCKFRGARLPTEAEFERAARGALQHRYPWGGLYNSHAANHGRYGWHPQDASDGFAELAPVGCFPSGRTPAGFLDLAGNVREWVSDRYLPQYDENDRINPQGPGPTAALNLHVVRGGGYQDGPPWLRAAARDGAPPDTRRPDIGFRCARSARYD